MQEAVSRGAARAEAAPTSAKLGSGELHTSTTGQILGLSKMAISPLSFLPAEERRAVPVDLSSVQSILLSNPPLRVS